MPRLPDDGFAGGIVSVVLAAIWISVAGCSNVVDRPATDTLGTTLYEISEGSPCVAPPARLTPDRIVIRDADTPPCRFALRETGIVLRGTPDGGVPYPGRSVARDSRGRFFSSVAGDGTQIAVWHADGSFAEVIGRRGSGPGEFPGGPELVVFTDAADNVYVRASGGRWTVFDSSLRFTRAFATTAAVPQSQQTTQVLRDGRVVESSSGRDGIPYFSTAGVAGRALRYGELIRSKGSIIPQYPTSRAIIVEGDSTFWAGQWRDAALENASGYGLERWTGNGERLATLSRDAQWYRRAVARSSSGVDQAPSPPTVVPIHVDREGRLVVLTWVANRDWRVIDAGEDRSHIIPRMENLHIDVIDTRSGVLLASEVVRVSGIVRGRVPRRFFPGTHYGYFRTTDDAGDPAVEIVEYSLVGR